MSTSDSTEQHYVECATCKNYSKFYCNSCHQRLCQQCRDEHLRRKENRKHEVVLYQDRSKELPTEKCPIHPAKNLDQFCIDCPAIVCSKCFAIDHNGHLVLDCENVYNACLQQCQEELVKIRDIILPQCEEEVKSHDKDKENAKKKIAKLRLSMKQSAEEIKAAVDTILYESNAKLDIIEASVLGEIVQQKKKVEDYISYLNKLIKDYTSDLSSCKLTEIISFNKKCKIVLLMKFPEINKIEVPTFMNGTKLKEEIETIFGQINPCADRKIIKELKEIQKSIDQFNSKTTQKLYMELSSISEERKIRLSGLNEIIHLSPAVQFGMFWASDSIGNLIEFDMQGYIHRKISTTKQGVGYHAVTKENNLLYTDYITKSICRVNTGMKRTVFASTGDWEPRSICSSHINEDILVGMKKNEKWKITRYNKEGIKVQDIQKNNKGEDLYSSVSYITENINGDICTSDCDAGRVQVVTGSGDYRFSYSGELAQNRFAPQGICTDVNGNILIANSPQMSSSLYHRMNVILGIENEFDIHLLDQQGQFLTCLFNKTSFPPILRALCIDDQNNLIAGSNRSPIVRVFKYLRGKCA